MDTDFHLMEQSSPASQSEFAQEPTNSTPKARVGASTNDQRFLLVFILGSYFGPDLRDEVPHKSALQRAVLGLPPYTAEQLVASVFKLSEIESIYYYALRNAHPSARVKLQSLYKFLQGHLAPPVKETLEDMRQFTAFFPHHLHRHARYKGTYKVVESMVFIHDPDTSYMKPEDIERFKRLSGLSELALNWEDARSFQHGQRSDRDEERQARFHAMAEAHGHAQEIRGHPLIVTETISERRKRKKRESQLELLSTTSPVPVPQKEEKVDWSNNKLGATMLLLPALPTVDQWNAVINAAKPSIVLSGDFKCEVECDGKVMIKGTTTTGESRMFKGSRLFHMQTQYLCPPGAFTVSFYLPGPVEPNQFTGTFGSDGILEGIVMKQRARTGAASLIFES
ncbi:hypothetical protein CY35_10G057500 [Sphagnum magellanicum]|nr:hypothetical protein CY35_10G057500 [Sphagnum magellanicum]